MRIWGKLIKDNRLIKDYVAENYDTSLNRTRKVYACLDEMCYEFDLPKPIWLESNKKDFILHDRTRFRQESFIEGVNFDYMDFQVIEYDY